MTAPTRNVREVIVLPLAAKREALGLICMIGFIIMLMAIRFATIEKTITKEVLKQYQQKDTELESQAPILYRSLLSVVEEIKDIYTESGSWPEVDVLRDETLPPFATNFLPAGVRGYGWTLHVGNG